MLRPFSIILFLAALTFSSLVSFALEEGEPPQANQQGSTWGLKKILIFAKKNSLEFRISESERKILLAEKEKIESEFAPRIKSLLGAGPITKVTGNALEANHDRSRIGVALLANLEFQWPLWSWGRKKDYLRAVEQGALTKDADSQEKLLEISYRLKEAYYGFLLANSLQDLVVDLQDKSDSAVKELKKKNKKTKKEDLYQIEILQSELVSRKAQIEAAQSIAFEGLWQQAGFDAPIVIEQKWLGHQRRKLKDLSFYQNLASEKHPKFSKVAAGLKAKSLLIEAEKKGKYPFVGFLFKYNFADADVRENQKSLFAYDPYNTSEAVVGVGLQWNYQWGQQEAKISKLRAESQKLQLQQSYAQKGLLALVKKAWLEVKSSDLRLKALKKGQKTAKKWLGRSLISWGSGFGESKKIIDAFSARAQTRKGYLEALYEYELAWAKLSRAVGSEVDPMLSPNL